MPSPKFRVLIPEQQIQQRIREIAAQIDADYPEGQLYVVGILKEIGRASCRERVYACV